THILHANSPPFPYTTLFRSKHLFRAAHEIKLGFDFNSVSNRLNYAARPVNITRADGTLAERIIFHSVRLIQTGNREYVGFAQDRSEEHTSELQSLRHLVCRL